ncbi:MAG: hypothetical protein ACRC5C_01075, partial [Bacilli bacterium]
MVIAPLSACFFENTERPVCFTESSLRFSGLTGVFTELTPELTELTRIFTELTPALTELTQSVTELSQHPRRRVNS